MSSNQIRMPGAKRPARPAGRPSEPGGGRPFTVVKGYKNKLTLHKAIIIVGILILLVLSGQRMIKIVEQRQMINQLQLELETERIRNQQLVQEMEMLQSPEGIERIAREQLGLVKPNEIVIRPITLQGSGDQAPADDAAEAEIVPEAGAAEAAGDS